MIRMFLADVFYTKIIDNQYEAYMAKDVFLQSWVMGNCFARHCLRSLLVRMPAWGNPYIALQISI